MQHPTCEDLISDGVAGVGEAGTGIASFFPLMQSLIVRGTIQMSKI